MVEQPNITKLSLTKGLVSALFAYYGILLLSSLQGVLFFFRWLAQAGAEGSASMWATLAGSFLSAVLGSAVYYGRKLYKSCIRGDFDLTDSLTRKELGAAAYFVSRPMFSCAFAFLAVVSLKAENQFVSPGGVIQTQNFMYVCMFVSFLSGFSAGKVIAALEKKGAPIDEG